MSSWNIFLWVIFPYLCLTMMIVGIVWRWRTDKFGWTTRSSEIYERTWLRIASPLFHFGILFVILGHIAGLVIPESWTNALGISEAAYHGAAVVLGTIAAMMTVVGLIGLLVRRFVVKSIRLATSRNDILMYVLLCLPIGLGSAATITQQIFGQPGGYNYRESISPWFRSLFIFQPDLTLMAGAPGVFKAHVIAGFLLFAIWPFTRLVHAVTPPITYPVRPYIVYRSRDYGVGQPAVLRGWGNARTRGGLDNGGRPAGKMRRRRFRTSYENTSDSPGA